MKSGKTTEISEISIIGEIKDAFKMVFKNFEISERIAKDEGVTHIAFFILFLSTLINTAGIFLSFKILPYSELILADLTLDFDNFIKLSFLNFVFEIFTIFVMGFFAEKLFASKGKTIEFFRVAGYASIVKSFNVIPILGVFSGIWYLFLQFKALKKIFDIKFLQIIFILIIATILVGVIAGLMDSIGFDIIELNIK